MHCDFQVDKALVCTVSSQCVRAKGDFLYPVKQRVSSQKAA